MRVGIMMGSFNPPHLAHLELLKMAKAASLMDTAWIVPVPGVPSKKRLRQLSIADKIEMCRLLARDHDWIDVYETSDHHVPSDSVIGYLRSMAQIVESIRARYGHEPSSLCLLCGADAFRHLRVLAVLLRLLPGRVLGGVRDALAGSTFIVAGRGEQSLTTEGPETRLLSIGRRAAPIRLVALPELGSDCAYAEVSSTRIRAAIEAGGSNVLGLNRELEDSYRLAIERRVSDPVSGRPPTGTQATVRSPTQ